MPNPAPPMQLGETLDYPSFRIAGRTLLNQRQTAVAAFERQAKLTAESEADYQRTKARRYVEIKATGGSDKSMVSAAEAGERIKGDEKVAEAMIDRDLHRQLLNARKEKIAGIDEALATLRRVADWSQALEMRGLSS